MRIVVQPIKKEKIRFIRLDQDGACTDILEFDYSAFSTVCSIANRAVSMLGIEDKSRDVVDIPDGMAPPDKRCKSAKSVLRHIVQFYINKD